MNTKILKELIKKFLNPPNKFMNKNSEYKKYNIGNYTYGFPKIYDSETGANLIIGKYCSISSNVIILLSDEHKIKTISTFPFNTFWGNEKPFSKGNIIIGNDVWIGINVIILSGVTIGDGAVIGAGSVISKNIPAYAIVIGNPARIIKYRFSQEKINYLLNLKWWNWNHKKIRDNADYFYGDIDDFIKKFSVKVD